MGVYLRGLAVGRPARMGNSHCAFRRIPPDPLLKGGNFAHRFCQIGGGRVQDSDTARVVATIIEPLQSLEQYFPSCLLPNIGDNSTHTSPSILPFRLPSIAIDRACRSSVPALDGSTDIPARGQEPAIHFPPEKAPPGSRHNPSQAYDV